MKKYEHLKNSDPEGWLIASINDMELTIEELRGMIREYLSMKRCPLCHGKGEYMLADGDSDYDIEECGCEDQIVNKC